MKWYPVLGNTLEMCAQSQLVLEEEYYSSHLIRAQRQVHPNLVAAVCSDINDCLSVTCTDRVNVCVV